MPRNLLLAFVGILILAALPIWSVEHFVNQDGPAHVYSAFVASELLRGNEFYGAIYELNPAPVPNSLGHWLLMLLLLIFDKFVAIKVMATLTFACHVSSLLWLRSSCRGADGILLTTLFAAAVAFNWLWLQGFYNFILGLSGFAFTLGIYIRWRGEVTLKRTLLLAVSVGLVYFSHLLCFAAVAGSLIVLAVFKRGPGRWRGVGSAAIAIVPSSLLYAAFLFTSDGGGGFSPAWANLAEPFALSGWIAQMRTADPFLILSRGYAPFVTERSRLFLIFAPVLWIVVGVGAWLLNHRNSDAEAHPAEGHTAGFFVLLALFLTAALLAPDSLGDAQGSLLRPRMILFAAVVLVPLLPSPKPAFQRTVAVACLAFAVAFQFTSLWECSLATDGKIAPIVASAGLAEGDGIVAVLYTSPEARFAADPRVHAGDLLAVDRNVIVWNSFEFGYSFFPVRMRSEADRQLVNGLEKATAIVRGSSEEQLRLSRLGQILERERHRISSVVVLEGGDELFRILEERSYENRWDEAGSVRVFGTKGN